MLSKPSVEKSDAATLPGIFLLHFYSEKGILTTSYPVCKLGTDGTVRSTPWTDCWRKVEALAPARGIRLSFPPQTPTCPGMSETSPISDRISALAHLRASHSFLSRVCREVEGYRSTCYRNQKLLPIAGLDGNNRAPPPQRRIPLAAPTLPEKTQLARP